jgi:HEAT repeat protein
LIVDTLEYFWADLQVDSLSDLAQREGKLVLWVFLDGSDDLSDRQRRQAWRELGELVDEHPEHGYLLTGDRDRFVPRLLSDATDLLVIQPLSRRAIEAFLRASGQAEDMRLYRALGATRLFDLAETPWLLAQMMAQARQGAYPRSRTEVLEGLVEDAIANLSGGHILRARAAETLYALAYETKSQRHQVWDIGDAFRVMASVRENREYSLEDLYEALIASGLLARVGEEGLRFAYPAYENYCCAKAIDGFDPDKRDRVLEDIAASLGRLTRLRAWEGTLVLLSGLMSNPNVLLRKLLYGTSLGDGEQVYVAVRCLQESVNQRVDDSLWERVVDALIWRLDPANVRRSERRARAAQALGELRSPSSIPYLARAANQPVRVTATGGVSYDYSNVRMAAVMALRGFLPKQEAEVRAADVELADLLVLWTHQDAPALATWLRERESGSQSLAAVALGDLYRQGIESGLDTLVDVFTDPDVSGSIRWAVADAMTLLDPMLVTRRAILPLIDEASARKAGLFGSVAWNRRAFQYERLAYLIGLVRSFDPTARAFLGDRLEKDKRVAVKGKAMQSIAWLYDGSYKEMFERIANGDFREVLLSESVTEEDKVYLRRKAIEALAYIGDEGSLRTLRSSRSDWTPELQQAFYETSEEIVWRQGLGQRG